MRASSTFVVGLLISQNGCAVDTPPGLGDKVVDSSLEVVATGGTARGIGTEFKLSELAGKPVILDFWASWCGPCRLQHQYVADLKARYGDRIEIVGVLTRDLPENARVWLQREGSTYPTVLEDKDALVDEFWVSGLPRFVLLDPEGRLSWDFMGAATEANPWTTDSVEVRIEQMLHTSH